MQWNNDMWHEMNRLQKDVNRLFGRNAGLDSAQTYPLINIYEETDNYVVTAELPGATKDQVNITFTDDVLTLSGEHNVPDTFKEMSTRQRSVSNQL